jgi:hypothetical protein
VKRPPVVNAADRDALTAWLTGTHVIVEELHALALDATARRADRRSSRAFLRQSLKRKIREVRARLDALAAKPE